MHITEIKYLAQAMGFFLDLDASEDKRWIRFQLRDDLDEPDLRWIWRMDDTLYDNVKVGANILFKAGQKEKLNRLTTHTNLY